MTDPLPHLYAETGAGIPGEALELPTRSTSIDELNTVDAGADEISDADADELVLLLESKVDAGTLTNEETVELGLGEIIDGELHLNPIGLRVARGLLDRHLGRKQQQ